MPQDTPTSSLLMQSCFNLLDQVRAKQNHWLLALSGGVDSVVLLDLISRYKAQNPEDSFSAIHVHHSLSCNADYWASECQTLCDGYEIPLIVERVHLELGARISIEKAARDARYAAIEKHTQANTLVLTAQHASDQVETFLLALKRGSGPQGLGAMAQVRKIGLGKLVRPLLDVSRSAIEAYAQAENLTWIEDESNQDHAFDRNYLRHQVIPHFTQRWPSFEKTLARSAKLCAETDSLLKELLTDKLSALMDKDSSLAIEPLDLVSGAQRDAILRLWLEALGFCMPSAAQLKHIWQDVAKAKQDANPVFYYQNIELRRWQGRLYAFEKLTDIGYEKLVLDLNRLDSWVELAHNLGHLKLSLEAGVGQKVYLDPNKSYQIQFNLGGSTKLKPQGRQHSRILKKLWQEYQVPTWQRSRVPFLVELDGQNVVSALGLFVNQAFSDKPGDSYIAYSLEYQICRESS